MWAVFISSNGAFTQFRAFVDSLDKLLSNTAEGQGDSRVKFYAAFVHESDAKRFVDLINSATF